MANLVVKPLRFAFDENTLEEFGKYAWRAQSAIGRYSINKFSDTTFSLYYTTDSYKYFRSFEDAEDGAQEIHRDRALKLAERLFETPKENP
jgi:hypothetical protein